MVTLLSSAEMEATWELWRRSEGGLPVQEPTTQLLLDLDRLIVDIKPEDLYMLTRLQRVLDKIKKLAENTVSIDR